MNLDYLNKRLQALEITEEANTISVFDEAGGKPRKMQFFTADKNGNIIIHYFTPSGEIMYYEKRKAKNLLEYTRTRYNPANNPKNRYGQEEKSGIQAFSTPVIIKCYTNRQTIKTLFITEGEFKSFALNNFNVPCFGLGGIQSYKSEDKLTFNKNILEFIEVCKVENVVMLYDADCRRCKWEEGKDLYRRAAGFCASVKGFAEFLKPYNVDFYFAFVHEKFAENYKGIDDLLYSTDTSIKADEIIKELNRFSEGTDANTGRSDRQYIKTFLISGKGKNHIEKIFGIDEPQNFYNLHIDELREKDFVFKGNCYYTDDGGKVLIYENEPAKRPIDYILVGDKFYKKGTVKLGGVERKQLIPLNKDTVTIGMTGKETKRFYSRVEQYDGFTNEPENDPEKYNKTVVLTDDNGAKTKLYNIYDLPPHKPAPGQFPTIEKFFHHIFDYTNIYGEPLYNFALDYMKLLYERPAQKLPVLCLVSKENATGKTTFLELLSYIFGGNMCIISSAIFEDKFNDLWADKLVVGIDESDIPTERTTVNSKIKMICTNTTITRNQKNISAFEITNNIHLVICTNETEYFLKANKNDKRYCIIKVNPIPAGEEIPKHIFIDAMKKEVPAFLWFLKARDYTYQEKTRLYFDEKVFFTKQLKNVIRANEDPALTAIRNLCYDQYFLQETNVVYFNTNFLLGLLKEKHNIKDIKAKRIARIFDDLGIEQKNTTEKYYYYTLHSNNEIFKEVFCDRRRYVIPADKILNDDELEELTAFLQNKHNL